jgi:hypothetical protein
MHITDYGLWFYCVEEGVYFDKPEEFIAYMQSTYGLEELKIIAEQESTDGTSGFINRSCDILYNGSDIDTCLKMKYMPKIDGVSIETNRAKKILESECLNLIADHFNIMKVQKQQNRLGQALVLNYRGACGLQREGLPAAAMR